LLLSCEVIEKSDFWASDSQGEGDTPHFGHVSSNRTYFRACGQFWSSSVQRAAGVVGEKRRYNHGKC